MLALFFWTLGVDGPPAFLNRPVTEIRIPVHLSYMEFLEKNRGILYPAMAGLALVLILFGILQAWRGHEMDGAKKAEIKKDIALELRKAGGATSADLIAKAIGLEKFKTVKILEEMLEDGTIITYTNTQRLAVWQLKGTQTEGRQFSAH
jgi:hypothetical protein